MASSMETILEERMSAEISAIDLNMTAVSDSNYSPYQRKYSHSPKNESIKAEDASIFIVKNLDTGESLDMRNENSAQFPETYTRVLGDDATDLDVKEFFRKKQLLNFELCEASKENDVGRCRALLTPNTEGLIAAVNSKWLDDWTPLHIAANEGHHDILEVLLTGPQLADINARSTMMRTPLHQAVIKSHFEASVKLIHHDADINVYDDDGNTPLHLAAMYGHVKLVRYILDKFPVLSRNNLGLTAFEVAATYEIFKLIRSYAASVFFSTISVYCRVPFNRALLHNSRRDQVQKLMDTCKSKPPTDQTLYLFHNRPRLIVPPRKTTNRLRMPKIEEVMEDESMFDTDSGDVEEILTQVVQRASYRDFTYLQRLGRGSFGEVYLAKHILTDKLHALKILSKEKVIAQNLIRYCTTEKRVLAMVRHPFIVHLEYVFQTPQKLVLVMEFCRAGDLSSQLMRLRKLPEEHARIYAAEIILAIEELHRHNIIYRDLKPDNVVLDEEGHAHLTDFGLAKEGIKMQDTTKSFCGSIAYLAPEMLKRAGHSQAIDWYLLGNLMYEMLTGFPPFFSTDREKMFKSIQTTKISMPKNMSPEAKSLIEGLLDKNPAARLGGGPRGAEEIKDHPFFSGIDWNEVYNKKLVPPTPKLKPLNLDKPVPPSMVFGKLEEDSSSKINGWSVLIP
mmetsp:Transcript_31979/g.55121  ORF Transcript_31979/g.55121 Transcript_31979/m.55121 type:complete len:678 (+) Transcript_31979:70-2103(+)